jgi:hypothetical protein
MAARQEPVLLAAPACMDVQVSESFGREADTPAFACRRLSCKDAHDRPLLPQASACGRAQHGHAQAKLSPGGLAAATAAFSNLSASRCAAL